MTRSFAWRLSWDRVNTTMQVWMGLTFGCAQCHNHKYDPISQEDYYRFYAVFNNTEDADRGDERPVLESWSDEQSQQREHLTSKNRQVGTHDRLSARTVRA